MLKIIPVVAIALLPNLAAAQGVTPSYTPSLSALILDKVEFGTPPRVLVTGQVLKSAAGQIEVNFGYTFAEPPIVMLQPQFTGGVGSVETITFIDKDKFRLASS